MAKPQVLTTIDNYNGISDILTKLKTVDGAGSGLDADTVDNCSVNDVGTTTADLWTGSKITAQLALKEPTITKNTGFNLNLETSTANIKMNGTVSVGALSTIARADHIHPSDTTKANLASPTFTGTVVLPSTTSIGTVTSTEIGYLSGTTSSIQSQLGSKVPLSGGTMTGTLSFDTSAEKQVKGIAPYSWGMYMNSGGMGLYDWQNTRSIFSYAASSNSIAINAPSIGLNGAVSGITNLKMFSATGSGNAATSWIGFYDADGITRRGWVGDGGTGDTGISIASDTGDVKLSPSNNNVVLGYYTTRCDTSGGAIRIYTTPLGSSDSGFRVDTDGSCSIIVSGVTKHTFYYNGTKAGGSVEIDTVNYGMSPIDCPKVLIEDVMFNVEVNADGTIINIDDRFAKATTEYAIFPNNGKVVVSDKTKNNFKVSGFTGIIDIRIIGKRFDSTDVNWTMMD